VPMPEPAVLAAAGGLVDGVAEAPASSCVARAGAGWGEGGRGAGDSRTGDVGDLVGDDDANRAAVDEGAGAWVGRASDERALDAAGVGLSVRSEGGGGLGERDSGGEEREGSTEAT